MTVIKLTKRRTVSLRRDDFSTQVSAFIVNADNDDPVEEEVVDTTLFIFICLNLMSRTRESRLKERKTACGRVSKITIRSRLSTDLWFGTNAM